MISVPGGALAIPDADAVISLVNSRLAAKFDHVLLTQDWHPVETYLVCNNACRTCKPYEVIEAAIWPADSLARALPVQGSPGAELHPDLDILHAD